MTTRFHTYFTFILAAFGFACCPQNRDHAPRAIRAAAATGLPVCLGISTRLHEGELVWFGTGVGAGDAFDAVTLRSFIALAGPNLVAVNVMHTNFSAMLSTLQAVRACGWRGVLGAYPDHGKFVVPNWRFEEVRVDEALRFVDSWVTECGVALIGGCCGIGPDFIAALAEWSAQKAGASA